MQLYTPEIIYEKIFAHVCAGSGVTALLRGYEPMVRCLLLLLFQGTRTMTDVAVLLRPGAELWIDIRQMVGSASAMRYVGYARLRISENWAGDRLASEVDQLLPPTSHRRYREKASCSVGVTKD